MNADQGREFLKALGTKVESAGSGWLRAKCPLSRWTHAKGSDTTPSFGLTINESAHSVYHCFACSTGTPESLIQALEFHSEYGTKIPGLFDFKKAREILEAEELDVIPLPEYSEFGAPPDKVLVPWETYAYKVFPPAIHSPAARRYLAYRGFTLKEAKEMGLRVDEYRNMLVFPYWNVHGELCGMRGRLMDFGEPLFYQSKDGEWLQRLKHYDYTLDGKTNNSYFCWLYEPCLNMKGAVVVVEGQFDLLRVRRVFPRVVANLTAKPSKTKMQKLAYADSVILLLDEDSTGHTATTQWMKQIADLGVQVGCLDISSAPKSDFHLARSGPGKPKDPDEVSEAWLAEMLAPYL